MDKPLVYDSLAALVADYKASYEMWWHELVSVYVGLPVEHDVESQGQVYWRALKLKLGKNTWQKVCVLLILTEQQALDGVLLICPRAKPHLIRPGLKAASCLVSCKRPTAGCLQAEEALNQHAGAMRKMHSQLRAGILPAADLPSGPGKAERKPAVSSKTHTPSKPQQAAGSALGGAATGITTASSSATYGTAAATPSLQHEASNSSGPADDRAPTTASMMQGRADGDSDGAKGSKGSDSASTSEDEGDGNADGDGHGINIARAKDRPAG